MRCKNPHLLTSVLSPFLCSLLHNDQSGQTLVDVMLQWKEDWKSAFVVDQVAVPDPSIRQPGFDLPRRSWSLLNRFSQAKDHMKPTCTDAAYLRQICTSMGSDRQCPRVDSCPDSRLDDLQRLHDSIRRRWSSMVGNEHSRHEVKLQCWHQRRSILKFI